MGKESDFGKKVKANVDKFAEEHSGEIEKVKAQIEEGAKKAGEAVSGVFEEEEESRNPEESADAAEEEKAEEFTAEEETKTDEEPAAASEGEEKESDSAAVEEEEEKTDEQKENKLKKAQSRVFHGTAFAVVAATAAFGAVLGKVRKQKKAEAESEAVKPEEEETSAAPEAEENAAAPDADAEQKESAEPRPSEPSME